MAITICAMGLQALYSNVNGDQNVGVGVQALNGNQTGNENCAMGYRSLYSNTVWNSNHRFTAIEYGSVTSSTLKSGMSSRVFRSMARR